MLLPSIWEDADGLSCKVARLEGEHAKAHWDWEVAEDKLHSLTDASADGMRWIVASEMERQEQYNEFSLLQAWGAKLCLTIIGPTQVKSPLSVRMRAAALRHAGVVREPSTMLAPKEMSKLKEQGTPDHVSTIRRMKSFCV
jgi:hypothetical protein